MIKTTLTAFIVSALTLTAFVGYYPLFQNNNLGALSLTDISGSNTLSDFPTTYTANNTLIENAINTIEGTTTNSTITSLANLATVGTLTTGTWNADTLTVAYGGTGSTTLSQYNVLLGSSTNAVGIVEGLGTSGQFLTSQGAGNPPQWTTSSINEAGDYSFTGTYFGVDNLFATTTKVQTWLGVASTSQSSGYVIDINGDLIISGGIGTTTNGVIETTGDIYVGGGSLLNMQFGRYTNTGSLPTTDTDTVSVTATCGVGSVMGGGYSGINVSSAIDEYTVYQNYPNATTSWNVAVECEVSAGSCAGGTLTVYAICLDINP